jgi:hypothetical protein
VGNKIEDKSLMKMLDVTKDVLTEYTNNPHVVIPDPNTGRRLQFAAVDALLHARKARRQCMWPKCSATAISRSHTIPRGASLSQIARGGHLITPAFSQAEGRIVAQRIGINDASAIPAFCTTHEAEFFEFESAGYIETERALARQLFRSICREIVRLEVGVAHGEKTLADYHEFCRMRVEQLVRERSQNETVKVSSVGENAVWVEYDRRITSARTALEFFRSTLYPQAAAGLDNPDNAGLEVAALQLDTVIPVCLSGTGSFQVAVGDSTEHVQAVLAVVPGQAKTLIAIATAGHQKNPLALYRRLFMSNGFQLIGMIESWMIHGTNHWFLDPNVWNEVEPSIREQMMEDIEDDRPGIGTPYGRTIFNQLKRDWIRILDDNPSVSPDQRAGIRARIAPFTNG